MEIKRGQNRVLILLIVVMAFGFRFYGINWDKGHHLHPDERMIIMVTERIHLPTPLTPLSLLSSESPLNPKFFAYGSLPIYLLRLTGNLLSFSNPTWAHYQGLLYVGRFLSIIFELGTVIVIYKISKLLLPTLFDLLPSFFYALSVLAIQTSHFYVVDVPLTFFNTLTLYFLLKLIFRPSLKHSILVGTALGLALASKVSSILLIVPVLVTMTLIFIRKRNVFLIFKFLVVVFTFSFLFFNLTMPYALLDFPTFKAHTLEQSRMTKDAFVFPYTLQYVGTTPYLYQLKNMVLWGMGVLLGIISIVGTVFVSLLILGSFLKSLKYKSFALLKTFTSEESSRPPRRRQKCKTSLNNLAIEQFNNLTILLSFFWPYLLITGSFAIKFMRYWLPIYPLFCILAGMFISRVIISFRAKISKLKCQMSIFERSEQSSRDNGVNPHIKTLNLLKLSLITNYSLLITVFLWPLSFASIYSRSHTRVTASEWIYEHIPPNATIALEHWDDGLPLHLPQRSWPNYNTLTLPLYDADTKEKWVEIDKKLAQVDYIIIASNRLYVPLMKLTDCQKLPPHRCYPKTAEYYQRLFNGSLGFEKVAEFTSYPELPYCHIVTLSNCYIADDLADESFTVYDHPKVMIFKKSGNFTPL